jgi:energy-coupling factor transport system permease protein
MRAVAFGEYYNTRSFAHSMDPRFKITIAAVFMLSIVLVQSVAGLAVLLAGLLVAVLSTRVPFAKVLSAIKPMLFLLVFTFIANLFFRHEGAPVLSLGPLTIYSEAPWAAAFMTVRLSVVLVATALLGFTTSSIDLSDATESMLSPFQRFGMPAHEIGMMVAIALRFIPTLIEELDSIKKAQMARGADFETGNALKRARAIVPLLVPLFVSAFRHAEELAVAMEARCYHGREGRTRVRELTIGRRDWVATGAAIALVAALIGIRAAGL